MTDVVEEPARRDVREGETLRSVTEELLSVETARCFLRGLADRVPPYTAGWLRVRLLRAGGLAIGAAIDGGRAPSPRRRPDPAAVSASAMTASSTTAAASTPSAPITIDDGAYLGHDVAVLTSSHDLGPPERRAGTFTCVPIHIGRGVWIGCPRRCCCQG